MSKKSKKKNERLIISNEEVLRMNRAANREAFIEAGLNINNHRVYKNKKVYTRKNKHKK